jgi:hypothetical protein
MNALSYSTVAKRHIDPRYRSSKVSVTDLHSINILAFNNSVKYAINQLVNIIIGTALFLSCAYSQAGSITLIPDDLPYIEIGRLQDISFTFIQDESNSFHNANGTSNVAPCKVVTDRNKLILSTSVEGTISSPQGRASASSTCILDFEAYFQTAFIPDLRYKYGGFGSVNINPVNEFGTYGWSFGGFVETPEGARFDLRSATSERRCDGNNPDNVLFPDCVADWGGGTKEYWVVENIYFGPVQGSIWLKTYFDLSTIDVSSVPEPNILFLIFSSLIFLWMTKESLVKLPPYLILRSTIRQKGAFLKS